MRELTLEEQNRLEELERGLHDFVQVALDALGNFMERLELPQPYMVLQDAGAYLSALDSWMREQIVAPDDRIWILTRVGYFLGELLNQRFGGHWFVDDHPASPYFLQYVVGRFTQLPNRHARISPFALAANYVDLSPGRSLSAVVARVEEQLRQLS